MLFAAMAPLMAAACLSRRLRLVGLAAAALVAVAAFSNERTGLFRVVPGSPKAMRRRWTRRPARASLRPAGTPIRASTRWRDCRSPIWRGSTSTPTPGPAFMPGTATSTASDDMKNWYRALPFKFTPNADTLVIGPGGGPDVLGAWRRAAAR